MRLRYRKANEFLSRKDIRYHLSLDLRCSEIENRGEADDFTTEKTITVPSSSDSAEFLSDDEFVEVIELRKKRLLDRGR
jgi:hypothetical protein